MNKIFMLIIFIILCISCNSCNQSGEYILPTFKPLDNTEDVILVENTLSNLLETEIIAIDTSASKIKQVYRLGRGFFPTYLRQTQSGYCYFTVGTTELCLNIKNGKCKSVLDNVSVPFNNIYGDCLVFSKSNQDGVYCYNPRTEEMLSFETDGQICSDVFKIDVQKIYAINYLLSLESEEFAVYNLITNTKINLDYEFEPFEIHGKYLVSNDNQNGGFAIHEIISFEPVNLKFITHLYCFIDDIAEDNDYIYIGGHRGYVKVIRKSDSQIIAEAKDLLEIEGGGLTVIKNGYAWLGADQDSGDFIRVDLTDDDGDGVLKWQLIKSLD